MSTFEWLVIILLSISCLNSLGIIVVIVFNSEYITHIENLEKHLKEIEVITDWIKYLITDSKILYSKIFCNMRKSEFDNLTNEEKINLIFKESQKEEE